MLLIIDTCELDCSGLIVWRYNEEKTLEWLTEKTNKVAEVLKSKHVNVNTSCAVSKTFIKSTTEADRKRTILYSVEHF